MQIRIPATAFLFALSLDFCAAKTFEEIYPEYLKSLNGQSPSLQSLTNFLVTENGGPTPFRPLQVQFKFSRTGVNGPRDAVVISNNNPSDPLFGQPVIFLANTPSTDTLEIISLNREGANAGDLASNFNVVPNFTKVRNPGLILQPSKLVEVNCKSCHQNKSAHLTPIPWSEGIGGNNGVTSFFDFDKKVRQSNRLLQASNICRALGAEGDLQKRKALLALSFMSLNRDSSVALEEISSPAKIEALKLEAKKVQEVVGGFWPAENFAVVSSVLPDRIVPNGRGVLFFGDENPQENDEAIRLGLHHYREEASITSGNAGQLEAFRTEISMDHPAINPQARRPTTHPISMDVRGMLNLRDLPLMEVCFGIRFDGSRNVSFDFLKKEILDSNKYDDLLATWPTKKEMLKTVVEKAVVDFEDNFLNEAILARMGRVGETVTASSVSAEDGPKIFQQHCADCHAPDRKKPILLERLTGVSRENLTEVVAEVKAETMPPPSYQKDSEKRMTANERAALLQFLEGLREKN